MAAKRVRTAESRRCALYVRISKDRANEVSTDVQREACAKYAKDRGWSVVDTFEDVGRSGFKKNTKRPAFIEMVEAVKDGTVDTVITYKLDRLSRSVRDFSNLQQTLADHGAEFISVTESFDTTTPMGRAMVAIASVFAELESAVKSERITAALAHQRARGSATNGPRPFGFKSVVGKDGKSRCDRQTLDPTEARLIRQAAKRVLDGDSLRSIVLDWNDRGVRTARGSEWNRRGLVYVLTSPTTAGLRVVDGSLVAGSMPAILDRETWEAVTAVLRDPSRRTGDGNGTMHLLSGVLLCARCETPMGTKPHRAGWRYVCAPRKGYDACNGVSIDGAKVDVLVSGAVVYRLNGDAVRKTARERKGSTERGDTIDDDLEALAADFGAGVISRREWQAARTALEARRDSIATERASGRQSAAFTKLASAKDISKAWAALDVTSQRAILTRKLVNRITVDAVGAGVVKARAAERRVKSPDSEARVAADDRLDIEWRA